MSFCSLIKAVFAASTVPNGPAQKPFSLLNEPSLPKPPLQFPQVEL
jgi:hypothetical protein